MKLSRLYSITVFLIYCLCTFGQSLDEAKSLYQEGRFAEALPAFQTEYINNPNNVSVNHWLGVCLLKTGKITEAQKYLEFASVKKTVDAYIYLGELYSLLYRFDDAEKEFEKYQKAKRRDAQALEILEQKRAYTDKLKRAVNRTEDIQIIDSVVVPKSAFLSAYNLSASSGSLIPLHEFFTGRPKSDEILYINERRDKIYYSVSNESTGKDLFTMDKLLDSFGNEKKLPESINKSGDQAFPFVLSDGLTLYYASTEEPSFGGYDLFITRYNLASDTYLSPNQMNMPYNSPFNDYMLAIDEEKGIGWFASDRYLPADSVCIYTFIPNRQVQLIESEDASIVAGRARIDAIADTWKEGTDYQSLRSIAKQKVASKKEVTGDFLFVINDCATYHTLSDFKNERARSIFSQALGFEKQLQVLNDELLRKREQFAGGETNNTLVTSIITLEKERESLSRELERLKVQARNEEIRTHFNQ